MIILVKSFTKLVLAVQVNPTVCTIRECTATRAIGRFDNTLTPALTVIFKLQSLLERRSSMGVIGNNKHAIKLLSKAFLVSIVLFAAAPLFAAQAPTVPLPLTAAPEASLNWSGYAATGGIFTTVSGTWTVPRVQAEDDQGYLSADTAWVGIGGVLGTDLIQAGTQAIVEPNGRITYQAWYEKLPEYSQKLPVSIRPGDSVSVDISRQGGSEWLISFKNNTTGRSFDMLTEYDSSLSSAEWVVETPSTDYGILPLSDFGAVNFTSGTTVKDGRTVTITESGATPIELTNYLGDSLAYPSDINPDGASFTVTRTETESEVAVSRRTSPFEYYLPDFDTFWEQFELSY